MNKKISLLFLSIVALTFSQCKKKDETIKPIRKSITESVYANGTVTSLHQYNIQPTVSGIVEKIWVNEGEKETKGQLLFSLKNNTPELMQESAEIDASFNEISNQRDRLAELSMQVKSAKSRLELDSGMFARYQSLAAQDASSPAELDQRRLALRTSRNNLNSIQLQYNNLEKQLKYNQQRSRTAAKINQSQNKDFEIRSMTTGILFKKNVESGMLVTPQVILGIVGDNDEFKLEMQVDERDILKIKEGQTVVVTFDTDRNQPFDGTVTKIIPFKNPNTKTFTVEATLDNPPTLYPNLSFEANIIVSQKENALLIPRRYLLKKNQVMDKDNKIITVQTGLKNYEMVEIISGIGAETELRIPDEL